MSTSLRVLHCVAGNLYGGVESFLGTLTTCRALSPRLDPEYALCFEGRLHAELRAAGAAVHRLGGSRFSRPWTVWRARRRLARLLEERRIDVVVSHCCWPQALCGPVARKAGRPSVYWMHEMVSEKPHWVERWAARAVPDLAIVNSGVTAEVLPRLYPRVWSEIVRYPVIARSVDRSEARTAVRAELGTAPEDVVVVMACRLDRCKGHPLLLSALGRLRDRPGWTAWIAGGVQRPEEQVYLDEVRAQARDLGIDHRLRFLGERHDVPRLMAAADIHCQPNFRPETFGITYIEALYTGLPVVSTRMGGAAEIVTDGCGVLTPPDDPSALAAALSAVIDDPVLRTRLGAAGPARAAELCAPEVVLPRLESLLLELHAARTTAGRGVPQPAA